MFRQRGQPEAVKTKHVRLSQPRTCVKVVRLFRSLRTLVQSLVGTLKSLAWAMVLLSLIMYIFSILFTDAALDFIVDANLQVEPLTLDEQQLLHDVNLYFGSLYKSFITMFLGLMAPRCPIALVLPSHQSALGSAAACCVTCTFAHY